MSLKSLLSKVTSTFFLLLELFLILRVLLRFFDASAGNALISAFYALTYIFVAPFQGIFPDQFSPGGGLFEMATISAIIGYFLVACLFAMILGLIPESSSGKK